MTWRELLAKGESTLQEMDIVDAGWDAWYLLEQVSGMRRAEYFMRQQEKVSTQQQEKYLALITQRSRHIPLQHLTNSQEFMGLEFTVGPQVLIPRQDTEILVEKLLPLTVGKRVLDMCTGSGCIAISLAVLGNPARVDAVDLSQQALQLAQSNANKLGAKVRFYQGDLFERITEQYDVIVSNPPYIATREISSLMPEVREHEPQMALDGGEDGLDFYRRMAVETGRYLCPGGSLWLEIGYDQKDSVSRLLQRQGYQNITCYPDFAGKDRVVCAVKGNPASIETEKNRKGMEEQHV